MAPPNQNPVKLAKAAELVRSSQYGVALTGAGISTPSGIPDFRTPGTGLWERHDPMEVASLLSFRYDPERFYSWFHSLARNLVQALPNQAHKVLARFEAAGHLRGVITQNIDGLHQKAGSQEVLEIHGNLRQATCIRCYEVFTADRFLQEYIEEKRVPQCPACGGTLKPDLVLFGEQMPIRLLRQAEEMLIDADLVIVAGSSLEVTPAATLPLIALKTGAHLVIVNREPTYLDERADVILREDIAEVFQAMSNEVLGNG